MHKNPANGYGLCLRCDLEVFLEQCANRDANPETMRLANKLATGAGKTTVMAMLIAWQTVNAVRRPNTKTFICGFLIITPGLTIRDRLRVLQPNAPDNLGTYGRLAFTEFTDIYEIESDFKAKVEKEFSMMINALTNQPLVSA